MIITIYKCEQCGKESHDSNFLDSISIQVNEYSTYPNNRERRLGYYKNICQECSTKLGIKFPNPLRENSQEEIKSLSQKLYDVICEIVHNETYRPEQ